MARPLATAIFAAALAIAAAGAAQAAADPVAAAQARGRAFAERNCAACHAVGPTGASPHRKAPPFRLLAGRFVPLTLQRRLTEISETGHYDMAPFAIHSDEASDVAAYMNSLERR